MRSSPRQRGEVFDCRLVDRLRQHSHGSLQKIEPPGALAFAADHGRRLEKAGVIGRLYDWYYVTTGNMANMKTMARIGAEMARDMRAQGIQAAILTAT